MNFRDAHTNHADQGLAAVIDLMGHRNPDDETHTNPDPFVELGRVRVEASRLSDVLREAARTNGDDACTPIRDLYIEQMLTLIDTSLDALERHAYKWTTGNNPPSEWGEVQF